MPQGWAVPWGGLSPGFYRVARKCNSPPDRVCQSELGLGSSELGALHSIQMLGKNPVFPENKWVASGTSVRWSWLIFRATTFAWRLWENALCLLGPLDASSVRPLC